MDFDNALAQAWNDHADQPAAVLERVPQLLGLAATAAQFSRVIGLGVHLYGEHLARWQDGRAWLDALRGHPSVDAHPALATTLAQHGAALACCAGDADPLERLDGDTRIAALASAASTLAGRSDFAAAIAALERALVLAEAGLPDGSAALRALAVAGNNLAAALEEHAGRSDAETRGMLTAAQAGLRYWQRAGGWLEHERAEYRLARSFLQAGRPAEAGAAAQRCLAVCAAHEAPAFERFFGAASLAMACRAAEDTAGFERARAAAMEWYAQVPSDEQAWCADDLAALTVGVSVSVPVERPA